MFVPRVRVISRFLFLLAGFASGCSDAIAQSEEWVRESVEPVPAAPRLVHELQTWRHRSSGAQTIVQVVRFQASDASFRVVDQGAEGARSLAEVMQASSALAGINGGYFHPDRQPLGLVVANGSAVHAEERARLLSGVLLLYANGVIRLQRVDEPRLKTPLRDALQAGPFLVDAGRPVAGLDDRRGARRSVVATDGAGTWAILTLDDGTLAETASLLATPGVLGGGKRVARAESRWRLLHRALEQGAGATAPRYSPEFGTVQRISSASFRADSISKKVGRRGRRRCSPSLRAAAESARGELLDDRFLGLTHDADALRLAPGLVREGGNLGLEIFRLHLVPESVFKREHFDVDGLDAQDLRRRQADARRRAGRVAQFDGERLGQIETGLDSIGAAQPQFFGATQPGVFELALDLNFAAEDRQRSRTPED